MKNIEIKTTQNVVLEYELATLRDRVLAFLTDLIIIIVGVLILSVMGFGALGLKDTWAALFVVFLFAIFFFYAPTLELLNNGQSLGKMALGIQVIKTSGGQATFADYAARWAFRSIDIYFSLGGIAAIMVASSSNGQRIGDIVANTTVIKVRSRTELMLKDLLAIHNQGNYKPVYPEVKYLQEEDVLTIKSALDRQTRFDNPAHRAALQELADKITDVLGIENRETSERKFLQVVLKDYVVLTR